MQRNAQFRELVPSENGEGFSSQRGQYEADHMIEPLVLGLLRQEVAAEDHAQGRAVGEIEEGERRDRNVELYRIDRDLEIAAGNPTVHDRADHLDEGRMHGFNLGRMLQVPGLREILRIQERQEFRVAQEIVPGEVDQALDRLGRIEMFKVEPALLSANLLISAFENREVQTFLVADMVVQHALVGAGLGRNAVDAGAGKAVRGKLLLGGLENATPHTLGVTLPL